MRASLSIDELRTHPHSVAALLLTPLQHIAHPEISADLFYVNGLALIREGGAAGDHKAMANTRETSGQLLGEDIREIILGWVTTQIGERQHDHGEPRRREQTSPTPPIWSLHRNRASR